MKHFAMLVTFQRDTKASILEFFQVQFLLEFLLKAVVGVESNTKSSIPKKASAMLRKFVKTEARPLSIFLLAQALNSTLCNGFLTWVRLTIP
jgi:hypothetical protein